MRTLAALALLLALARPALAQSTLMAAAPEVDEETGELVVILAGRGGDGAARAVGDPQLFIDGGDPVAPSARDKLLDYASDHPKWNPPFAIGVVYLWSTGAPSTIMDGLEALFRRVPGRVAVYPTPYGQGHRQVVSKLTASRVAGGELADYPQIAGDQMKLDPATRFNAAKLAEDRAPIKMMYIITDGRGPPTANRQYGVFGALGEDLRARGLEVSILGLPAPVDQAEARTNVNELRESARARLVKFDRGDVAAAAESLAEPLSSYERVRFALPWLTRQMGGEHRLVIKAAVQGSLVRAQPIPVNLPGKGGPLLLGGAVGVVALFGIAAIVVTRRRSRPRTRQSRAFQETVVKHPPPPTLNKGYGSKPSRDVRPPRPAPNPSPPAINRPVPVPPRPPVSGGAVGRGAPSVPSVHPATGPQVRPEPLRPEPQLTPLPELDEGALDDVAEIIRAGLSAPRAALALARHLGAQADQALDDPRLGKLPVVATRAGQNRLRDLRRLFASRDPREVFVRDVAPLVTGALREQAPAREAARRLRARLSLDAWPTVMRLRPELLEDAITNAAVGLPDLGTPAGRSYARDVQRELARPPEGAPLTFWLVEVAGAGPPGRNILIYGSTTVGGPGSATVLTDDPTMRPNQAEIAIPGNDVTISPLDGPVQVDGEPASAGTPITDGQVVAIDNALYVARLVRRHVALPSRR